MEYDVPFYSNTDDDTHCVQASLRMILKYFQPDMDYTWEKLEKITAKDEVHWTWPLAMLIWLSDKGFDVTVIDMFDYEEFIKHGERYMLDNYGEEVGQAQNANSDIAMEQTRAKEVLGKVDKRDGMPTESDIKNYLKEGYLVLCRVNSCVLNGKEGYMGHSIVIKGYNDTGLIINDPGLPPLKDRYVTSEDFERAWAYPDKQARNLTAVRYGAQSDILG